jgi:hypothetical protein
MKSWRSVKVTAKDYFNEQGQSKSNEQLKVNLMKGWRLVKVTANGQSNEELEVSQSYS